MTAKIPALNRSLGSGVFPWADLCWYTLFQAIKGNVLKVMPRIIAVSQPKKMVNPYPNTSLEFVPEVQESNNIAINTVKGKAIINTDSKASFIGLSIFLRIRCW